MMTVHHLEMSRSQRILWLLKELGEPYEIRLYRRGPASRLAPPELKRIHPLCKSPVVTDGDAVVAESGAIIEYLTERFGAQAPADLANLKPACGTAEHRQCRFWCGPWPVPYAPRCSKNSSHRTCRPPWPSWRHTWRSTPGLRAGT